MMSRQERADAVVEAVPVVSGPPLAGFHGLGPSLGGGPVRQFVVRVPWVAETAVAVAHGEKASAERSLDATSADSAPAAT